MIEIRGIKVHVEKGLKELERQIMRKLHCKELPPYVILKRSIDARRKPDIYYIYQVGVTLPKEARIVKKLNDNNIMLSNRVDYRIPDVGEQEMEHHPLIIGAGPAGLFCALLLAKRGFTPIVVERGLPVEERLTQVEAFWKGEALNPECNVQFGEGGAGTFSDGKLNTQVKDKYGRIRYVLEEFVQHGAPQSILYDNKPHIGTDLLIQVVRGIRQEIEELGGLFLFDTKAVDIRVEEGQITAVELLHNGTKTWVASNHVVLAIGHSARDTVAMLHERVVTMRPKDFAIGVRVEHPAQWIQQAMYGKGIAADSLPAAPYKLTYQASNGRGVYSFCMCPGGYVVNASSEPEHTAVNGMSYSGRDGANSNSAIVVTVRKEDYGGESPLAGVEFQRSLEAAVYAQGKGKVVVQRFEDFEAGRPSKKTGTITPQIKGTYTCGNVAACLPDYVSDAIIEGIQHFEQEIPGFSHPDTILSGVESRTSSPVRIERSDEFQSNISGVYPCGEGAGYAGGIMSAAMDGMKVAEAIIQKYYR